MPSRWEKPYKAGVCGARAENRVGKEERGEAARQPTKPGAPVAAMPQLLAACKVYCDPNDLDRHLAGNTIDFYTKVLGASFSDAMKEITET